jgi:hypothetical protein
MDLRRSPPPDLLLFFLLDAAAPAVPGPEVARLLGEDLFIGVFEFEAESESLSLPLKLFVLSIDGRWLRVILPWVPSIWLPGKRTDPTPPGPMLFPPPGVAPPPLARSLRALSFICLRNISALGQRSLGGRWMMFSNRGLFMCVVVAGKKE